jgi:hypothetical protein
MSHDDRDGPGVTTALTVLVVLALVVEAGLALATAAGRPLDRASRIGALVAEGLLVVSAVIDLGRIAAGHRPDELVVHLGYVLVSVLLLPLLVRPVAGGLEDVSDDDRRGRQLVLSVACLAVLVVVWRQRVTA